MPRYFGHCPKHSIIQSGLADLGGEVLRDHSDRGNHLLSFIEIFDAHKRIVAASPAAARLPRDEVHRPRKPGPIIAALVRICEVVGRFSCRQEN
jgi:hypothetical protein